MGKRFCRVEQGNTLILIENVAKGAIRLSPGPLYLTPAMTTSHDGSSDSSEPKYLTKKVVLNGQTVTLYSLNGATWLSSPDQLPDVMARLDNTRILLTDPKAAAEQGITAPPAPPKSTGARYRMKGPKPRPILQPDGTLLPPSERLPAPAVDTEVKLSADNVEVLDDSPAERIRQLRAPKEAAKKAELASKKQALNKASTPQKVSGGKALSTKQVPTKAAKVAAGKVSESKAVDSKSKSAAKSQAAHKTQSTKNSASKAPLKKAKQVTVKPAKASGKAVGKIPVKKVQQKAGKGNKKK
jgi:hypothetical protein